MFFLFLPVFLPARLEPLRSRALVPHLDVPTVNNSHCLSHPLHLNTHCCSVLQEKLRQTSRKDLLFTGFSKFRGHHICKKLKNNICTIEVFASVSHFIK